MSRNQDSNIPDLKNQRLINDWMKRNKSGFITVVEKNVEGLNSLNGMQNGQKHSPIIVSVTKKDNNQNPRRSLNEQINKKRNSMQPNAIKRKIGRWSSPAISIKIEPAKTANAVPESCSDSKSHITLMQVSKPAQSSKGVQPGDFEKIFLPATTVDINDEKRLTTNQKSIINDQKKDEHDVYRSILDNYKYLLTPKHWSVIEFVNEPYEKCIVFSKPHVINRNGHLISMMQKSLIIDKGGTIHYTVHGLPVNVKGTILPNALDNVKKLLSILHIFDKMQVCKGIGNDLLIVKTDNLLEDTFEVWRHTDCKLLLIKIDQCQTCLDARNVLLENEMLFKSELLSKEHVKTETQEIIQFDL